MKKHWAGCLAIGVLLTACSSGSSTSSSNSTSAASTTTAATSAAGGTTTAGGATTVAGSTAGTAASVSGSITVLTNRTDLVNSGAFRSDYIAKFNQVYPNIKVTVQGITDYEGEVKIRMNTDKYGDVLLIPRTISQPDYPKFFEPLGSAADLSQKYRFTASGTVDGKVYALAQNGNANGFVYNKTIWTQAGITKDATTPDEFIADLQAIGAKTSATPYYTNYHDGWPLSSWEGAVGSVTCDPEAVNKLATTDQPWTTGSELYTIDALLFNTVHGKLSEVDPTTTNWENSKTLLGTGKIATMWLGSWAVSQMRDAASKAGADPASIGFMPFPAQVGGKFCSVVAADYKQAINIHSSNKAAARAWLDWFTDQSGYAQHEGGIPTLKSAANPDSLSDYSALGVQLMELNPEDPAKLGLVDKIDNNAEIGLNKPDYRQNLVDVARGAASGNLDSIFAGLNKKWSSAVKSG